MGGTRARARSQGQAARQNYGGRPAGLGQNDLDRQARAMAQVGEASVIRYCVRPTFIGRPRWNSCACSARRRKSRSLDSNEKQDPIEIASRAMARAETGGNDAILIDTAGRLQIDEELMDELARLKAALNPHHIIFVADAMTGQEAANIAAGIPRAAGDFRRHPDQARLRRARRRGAFGADNNRRADFVCRPQARRSTRSRFSIRTVWPRASSGWAMC